MDLEKLRKALMFLKVFGLLRVLVVHCKFNLDIVPVSAFRSNKLELMGTASYFHNPFCTPHLKDKISLLVGT